MGFEWIKMRVDLQTHPKIVRILSATSSDKFRVIGGLHAVWSVFDAHSTDGKLPGYTPELMDHVIGWPGFSTALLDVGWLIFDGADMLQMPEFMEHNGKSAKRRAEDQKRKRNDRKPSANCPQEIGQITEKKRTREEKRRSKYSPSENIRVPKFAPPISPALLADWMEIRKSKKVGKLTATAWKGLEREATKAGITPEQAVTVCCEKGWAGFNADWDWQGKKQEQKTTAWWVSEQTIMAKARELGMQARPGESMGDFKGRIQARLAETT